MTCAGHGMAFPKPQQKAASFPKVNSGRRVGGCRAGIAGRLRWGRTGRVARLPESNDDAATIPDAGGRQPGEAFGARARTAFRAPLKSLARPDGRRMGPVPPIPLPSAGKGTWHLPPEREAADGISRRRIEVYPTPDAEIAINAPGRHGRSVLILWDSEGGTLYLVNMNGERRLARYSTAEALPDGFLREALADPEYQDGRGTVSVPPHLTREEELGRRAYGRRRSFPAPAKPLVEPFQGSVGLLRCQLAPGRRGWSRRWQLAQPLKAQLDGSTWRGLFHLSLIHI